MGTLGELFGVVRASAGETNSLLLGSLTSAQYPGRAERLTDLAASKKLPSVDQLETLWFMLQQELAASGEIVKFDAPVINADGTEQTKSVARVGPFTSVADDKYVVWDMENQKLKDLGREKFNRGVHTSIKPDPTPQSTPMANAGQRCPCGASVTKLPRGIARRVASTPMGCPKPTP